jgi:A/G-specific adenine glycosylase
VRTRKLKKTRTQPRARGPRRHRTTKPQRTIAGSAATVAPLLLDWFAKHARDLPWRRTADPYAVWVSEIMLQQTQVKTVIPYFERWMAALPTIAALTEADSSRIHKLWEGLGYYTRVRNMQSAAQIILAEHAGRFPMRFDDVLALPGIGRYTAGAVCSIAFNQPTPILDGNVVRVLTRLFGIREVVRAKPAIDRLWDIATECVKTASQLPWRKRRNQMPTGSCSALNQSLMELGALVCTPNSPSCPVCPLQESCVARRLDCTAEIPNLGVRGAITKRSFAACVIENDGAVLVRQRPQGVVNAYLWEFPNVEVDVNAPAEARRRALEAELGSRIALFTSLITVRHSITRYRISLEAFSATLNGTRPRQSAGQWVAYDELGRLAFTSAHRRVLAAARRPPACSA